MQPKISIIIPLYNGALLINRCLNSIFAQQSDFDLEVIIIDDGSTDNSVELVEQYPQPLVLLKQKNSGPAAARNKGIEAATGKYLAFLDADDYWMPTFLKDTVLFLENHSEAVAVSVSQIHKIPGKPDSISPKVVADKPARFKVPVLLNDFYSFWAEHNHVCTGSVLMKTEVVKQTGGQRAELRITEDLEFWAYLATFGQWGFIPEVLFVSDGGAVTKKIGWWAKNKKRWASAPGVEEWEKRVMAALSDPLPTGFLKKRGQIAKNLSYAMLLSARTSQARKTIRTYRQYFPKDKLSKLLIFSSKNKITWFVASYMLICRERFRFV